MNVILVGRNPEKLENSEKLVKNANKDIQTRCVVFDFNKSREASHYQDLFDKVKDLDISIVVNNAGVLYFGRFKDLTNEQIIQTIETNLIGPTYIMKIFIDKLRMRKNRSAFINVESQGGVNPLPCVQVYAATKAYGISLTCALISEHKHLESKENGSETSNIDFLSFDPAGVKTKMAFNVSGPGVSTPLDCANACFRDLGIETKTTPCMSHDFQSWMSVTFKQISDTLYFNVYYHLFALVIKGIDRLGMKQE